MSLSIFTGSVHSSARQGFFGDVLFGRPDLKQIFKRFNIAVCNAFKVFPLHSALRICNRNSIPVSYTHLDVYKRQILYFSKWVLRMMTLMFKLRDFKKKVIDWRQNLQVFAQFIGQMIRK